MLLAVSNALSNETRKRNLLDFDSAFSWKALESKLVSFPTQLDLSLQRWRSRDFSAIIPHGLPRRFREDRSIHRAGVGFLNTAVTFRR